MAKSLINTYISPKIHTKEEAKEHARGRNERQLETLLGESGHEIESICIEMRINRRLLVNSVFVPIHRVLLRYARVSSSGVHPQRRSIALISCLEQERFLMPRRNNAPIYRLRGISERVRAPDCPYMRIYVYVCLCM